ncbi:hypothetical protein [Roseibium sp. RKSG952]|uniref:hypothetical protein n=1 Tax=Roseibium sp. RKSG952 TaxID=2529384 RepID=UPI0018AD192E|nr:hypothetical protein [Roseibium sp. RKSG952]
MTRLDRLFRQAARREQRRQSLFISLLTGKLHKYFYYRLRFVVWVRSTQFITYAVEFLALKATFGQTAAFTIIIVRTGSVLFDGGWWGMLETMREKLRSLADSGQRFRAGHEIGAWINLSIAIAVSLIIGAALVLLVLWSADLGTPARIYAFLVVLDVAIRLPVRVLHSGIYATSRVYRPMWSMLVANAVQVVVLSAGLYFFPEAALILSILMSSLVSALVTLRYTLKQYQLASLKLTFFGPSLRFWESFPEVSPKALLTTSVAGVSLRLDSIIVLSLVGLYGENVNYFELPMVLEDWNNIDPFQFFYLTLPLLRGVYEICGVYYFDFVRFRRFEVLRDFEPAFVRKLLFVTPLVAGFYWLWAAMLGWFVLADVPFAFVLALLPLFALRGLLGIFQIQLFAEGAYYTLIGTMLAFGGALWLIRTNSDPVYGFAGIMAAIAVYSVVLATLRWKRRRHVQLPVKLTLDDWLRAVLRGKRPLLVGRFDVLENLSDKQRKAVWNVIEDFFHGHGHVAHRSRQTVFYCCSGLEDPGQQVPHLVLQKRTGGVISHGQLLSDEPVPPDMAVSMLVRKGWMRGACERCSPDTNTLKTAFGRAFTEGIIFDTETGSGARRIRKLDAHQIVQILSKVRQSAETGSFLQPLGDRLMQPVFVDGKVRLLLILPPGAAREDVSAWLMEFRQWQFPANREERDPVC